MVLLDASTCRHSHDSGVLDICNRQRVDEAAAFFLGPMPVQSFLHDFLPETSSKMPSSKNVFKNIPAKPKTEAALCEALARCLNRGRCPGFTLEATEARGGEGKVKRKDAKPNICLYNDNLDKKMYITDGHALAHLGYAEVFFTVKLSTQKDCFNDPPKHCSREERASHQFVLNVPEAHMSQAKKDFGQHVSFAAEACARQHRGFFFSVSMIGTNARLIRWDRAGAIATESFNIRTRPQWLCEFLWRLSHGTNEERGLDESVAPANDQDELLFRTVVEKHVQEQTGLSGEQLKCAVEEHYEASKVAIMHVLENGSTSADGLHDYLVSRPVVSPRSVVGRASRGYWAVCRKTKQIAFIKDTWRYCKSPKEGKVLQHLQEKGVRNIPVPVTHPEDSATKGKGKEGLAIKYQITRPHEFVDADCVCSRALDRTTVAPRKHYRLVLGTVGYPLGRLEGTDELLHGTFNAYEAMVDAFKKAGMIHRDISVGNILLVKDSSANESGPRKGYLIDWELSCPADKQGSTHRRNERTGTWPFMSHRVFHQGKEFVHHIIDDMESMMYVVLYCGLRYLPHGLPESTFVDLMINFFDTGRMDHARLLGGDYKTANMVNRKHTEAIRFECREFEAWLSTVMNYHFPSIELSEEERATFLGKWKRPDDLYEYWKGFLANTTLPISDRKEFEYSKHKYEPSSTVDYPPSATRPSYASRSMSVRRSHSHIADQSSSHAEDDSHNEMFPLSISVDGDEERQMEREQSTTMPSVSRSTPGDAAQVTFGTAAPTGSSSKQVVVDSAGRSKRKREAGEPSGSTSAQVHEDGGRQVKIKRGIAMPTASGSSLVDAAPNGTRRITRSMSQNLQTAQRKPSRRRK